MSEDKFIRVTLRLPKGLHETIAAEADRKTSTTNAEVVARLERSLADDEGRLAGASAQVSKADLIDLRNEIESLLDRKMLSLAMALNANGPSFGSKKV